MLRGLALVLVAVPLVCAQNSPPARPSRGLPVDAWLAERNPARFEWQTRVSKPTLSVEQRLSVTAEIVLEGKELVRRRGQGILTYLVRITDKAARHYTARAVLSLDKVTEEAAASNAVYSVRALLLPGEYQVDYAILDSRTGEHAAATRKLHVAALSGDPLPASWQGLPTVELIMPGDRPDVWYQPTLLGTLRLPVQTRRPVRVELLLNASPAPGDRRRSMLMNNQSLGAMVPGFKELSQMALSGGSVNASVIDLTRRQAVFTQSRVDKAHPLDWPKLKAGLIQANPNTIDVASLQGSSENAQFFVDQVRRKVLPGPDDERKSADAPPIALIVLSEAVQFGPRDDSTPIDIGDESHGRVFYIRYRQPLRMQLAYSAIGSTNAPVGQLTLRPPPMDDLLPLIKPLGPRYFDVYKPEDFRKAMAEIMREIARL